MPTPACCQTGHAVVTLDEQGPSCFSPAFTVKMFKRTDKLQEFYGENSYSLFAINILLHLLFNHQLFFFFFLHLTGSFRC